MTELERERRKLRGMKLTDPGILEQSRLVDKLIMDEYKKFYPGIMGDYGNGGKHNHGL